MATLTQEWATYASKTWSSGSSKSVTFQLQARYISQSISGNSSIIQTRLKSVRNSSSFAGYPYKFTCSYASTVSGSSMWTVQTETITTSSNKTITHNSNGTKTLSLSASASITGLGLSVSLSCNVNLPTIPRQATIKSAPNFNDEQNPTITYSNPAGNNVTTLKAGIFSTNGYTAYASYRNISKTGTSYTFTLTDAERNTLRNAAANSNTLSVRFYVQTVIGGNTYTSYLTKTLSIINATPTFTYTQVEQNSDVITYLGSSATSVIQNVSNVRFTATPTAYKGASISRLEVTNGSNTLTAQSPYQIDMPITANTTLLKIVDSRGNIATQTYEPTFIEYQNVKQNSFSFKRPTPTSPDVELSLDSVYYQQTFGSTANIPTVRWKLDDGDWNTISSSEYTIDTENNNLTLDYTLTNILDYRSKGTFYVQVNDLLSSWNNNNVVSKGIPVMEWGDNEVQINGDLYLADINRENVVNISNIINPSAITLGISADTNLRSTANYQNVHVPLNNVNSLIGTKLTYNSSSNGIVIGEGVTKVKVSALITKQGTTNTTGLVIYKNSSYLYTSYTVPRATGLHQTCIPSAILNVQEDDVITLRMYFGAGNTTETVKSYSGGGTYLTVEVIK